jgi:murein DD-endopeptidase MepM/ murein hydrolase activator NlpD
MLRSRWTLMIVPHDNDRVRSVQLSSASLRVALSLFVLLVLGLGTLSVGFLVKQNHQLRADRLERENYLLGREVEQIRSKMAALTASMDSLATREEKFRVIAGLESMDADVRRVGIGGPGTPVLEEGELYDSNAEMGEKVFAAAYDVATRLRRANLLRSSLDEAITTMELNVERLAAIPSIMPSSGYLSSLFSTRRRHPVLRITRPHQGIDISAPVGEPILAPAAGTIRFAGWRSGGYGNTVEIDHGFGIRTRFAHASRIHVRVGQKVERGQMIARVGATGLVTGPHLHYEVEVNGKPVDPLNFILPDALLD